MKRNIINGDIKNIDGMSLNKKYLNQTGITDFMPTCPDCVCNGSLFGGSTGTIDGGLMPAGSGVLAPTQDIANDANSVPFSLQPPTDSNNPFGTFEQSLGLAPATSTDQTVFQTENQANQESNAANCAPSSCSASCSGSGVGKALSSLGGAAAGAATQIGKTLGLNNTNPANNANGAKNANGNTTTNSLLVPALIGGTVLILVVVMLSVSLSGNRGNVNSSYGK